MVTSYESETNKFVVANVLSSTGSKVFAIQPALAVKSKFSEDLEKKVSDLTVLRVNNDPFQTVVDYLESQQSSDVVSVTSSLTGLFKSLPHLTTLKKSPVTVHVDVSTESDYGLIAALRHSGFVFLQSFGPAEAQQTALISHLIAQKLSLPVVHFFYSNDDEEKVRLLTGAEIQKASSNTSFQPTQQEQAEETTETDENSAAPTAITQADISSTIEEAFKFTKTSYKPFEYIGSSKATSAIVLFAANADPFVQAINQDANLGVVLIRVYRPWSSEDLIGTLPSSVKRVGLVEQIQKQTTAWSPLFQDFVSDGVEKLSRFDHLVSFQLGGVNYDNVRTVLKSISSNLNAEVPIQKLFVGSKPESNDITYDAELKEAQTAAKKLEEAYTNVLHQLFPSSLDIINASDKPNAGLEANPEYGFGAYLAKVQQKEELVSKARAAIKSNDFTSPLKQELQTLLSQWIVANTSGKSNQSVDADKLIELLSKDGSSAAKQLLESKQYFKESSSWLIGSDAWSYDLGSSGVHHVISSGKNINMLVIDSQPFSEVKANALRKKDIGLYAMNFGNVYVASVAVYASYTQLLQALIEAEKFDGPSVVVAYLPYYSEHENALQVLQETKKAVETGYWPLYRYDPTLESESFKLDSFQIRKSLQDFLDRENKLTLLSKRHPTFARSLQSSYGADIKASQKKRAQAALASLLEGLSGPPLTVLFASDGGVAESVAKRLQRRAKGRGLKSIVMSFDDYPVEEISNEENVVFVTSTAGQGELPQNGRAFWDAVKNATDIDLANVNFGVFGLGDSHYWPRKEDKIYYNKPAKDLYNRLTILGGKELVPLGLGDDQDADGYSTAYNEWEPLLWKALGVDGVAGADEPPPITNEDIKIGSNFLRGTIAEGLQDKSTGAIAANDQQLTKFHGIYMQDDRDIRDERKAAGLEPAFSFMVRVRLPGCVASPAQWLKIDELSDKRGNGTFKITTRGTFQLHGVIKENLKPAIRGINSSLIDTVAACGDVNRNVVTAALPGNAKIHDEIVKIGTEISEHLLPETTAYHEIWLEGEDEGDGSDYTKTFAERKTGPKKKKTLVSAGTLVDYEPLYGPTYLPRKFKINIAVPPYNDVDVYGHDIGLIAIVEDNEVVGFNVLAGGGMGVTHNNKKTYPRTGSLLGYVEKANIVNVCEKVMLVQRDNGDRGNRKHARLKYTVDDLGVDTFRSKVEKLLGYKFEPGRDIHFDSNTDTFGWVTDETGKHHFTTFVENGRVEDTPELQFKTGLREVAKIMKGDNEFRLTANQHILISNISDDQLDQFKELLAKYKLDNVTFSGLRLSSAACVAFPTCGLAMAESERYLPVLVTKLEEALEEYGLRHDSIVLRMTGCPNGCARPWLAEVALVGKAYDTYNLLLGGGFHGQRINKLYRSSIKEDEILAILKPLFKRWALERNDGEHFGDFLIRVGVIAETTEGKNFWDNVPEEA
ncbi:sulfite reductase (NADPH) subunit beta [Sugiyamaella lignohabitans]|uniref:Sulfite reductase [NADPH] subunit beta n=1 Tax=Sugiyamaella lignohabitans TaxID=796027 RepID=A0A167CR93_9ASCO|nr:sulfite reductase (NADPH) subunit beta [Sugiyamaella lignohabitans]ANB12012.1 sulfite reductase (NADPH) subunit beta [Sugiyamaella lignohabitans]